MSDHGTPERFSEGCKCPACKYAGRYPAVKERQRTSKRKRAMGNHPAIRTADLVFDPGPEPELVLDDPALEFFGLAGNKW